MNKTGIEWTEWRAKIAAKRIRICVEEYTAHLMIGEKWCTSCRTWHSRYIFPIDRSRGDGLSSSCRGYRPNRQKLSEEEKRERANASYRKYYAGNGGKHIRARVHARRRGTNPIQPEWREFLMELFDGKCAYCSRPADTIDHIVPVVKNGRAERGNLLPSCRSCNSRKGHRDVEAFMGSCVASGLDVQTDRIIDELVMAEVSLA